MSLGLRISIAFLVFSFFTAEKRSSKGLMSSMSSKGFLAGVS
jgi:hypothetical protein